MALVRPAGGYQSASHSSVAPQQPNKPPPDPSLKPHSTFPNLPHGFARTLNWTLSSKSDSSDNTKSTATFLLPTSSIPETFPSTFDLSLEVILTEKSLTTSLSVKNHPGANELKLKSLFHTYWAVQDSDERTISGVKKGVDYVDNIKGGKKGVWEGGKVIVKEETGKLSLNVATADGLTLHDGSRTLNVKCTGYDDCLVWTPKQKAGTSSWSDMEVGDGKYFVCIEPGYLRDWKILKAGEEFVGTQIATVV